MMRLAMRSPLIRKNFKGLEMWKEKASWQTRSCYIVIFRHMRAAILEFILDVDAFDTLFPTCEIVLSVQDLPDCIRANQRPVVV